MLLLAASGHASARQTQRAADTGVVHSKRLASGVPMGGIGCGTFDLVTDGAVSNATINNNWDQPTGDLNGCFAALWTRAGGRTGARALLLQSPYKLPVVSALDFQGLYPQAFVEYPDRSLPVTVSLRAFSPLIPHDVKNSALPVALFVFTIKNVSRAPVDAAVALSWENLLGVGGSTTTERFTDRTGNAVHTLAPEQGMFGLRFTATPRQAGSPADRLRENGVADADYALLGAAPGPQAQVTTAGWNALDATPGWWAQFDEDGSVAGSAGLGAEGSVHPAGVVAIRVALKDLESVEIPFAVAWYTPRLWTLSGVEYGHQYQRTFSGAVEVARYALADRFAMAALTDEWQHALLRSSLPGWLQRALINGASTLSTNSILTRDDGSAKPKVARSLFAMLESPRDGRGVLGALAHLAVSGRLAQAWFPRLSVQELREYQRLQADSGALPASLGSLEFGLPVGVESRESKVERPDSGVPTGAGREARGEGTADAQCVFVWELYAYYRATGDVAFLNEFYPAAKHAVQYVGAHLGSDGVPTGETVYATAGLGPERGYTATIWAAALLAARQMAEAIQDRPFTEECDRWLAAVRGGALKALWNGGFLRDVAGSEVCFADQLAGESLADAVQAPGVLPAGQVRTALASIHGLNDAATLPLPPLDAPPFGASPPSWPTHELAYLATLYAHYGMPDAALDLARRIDRVVTEADASPWDIALSYDASTGKPLLLRRHVTGPSLWWLLDALEGFAVDAPAGRLTLRPSLPKEWPGLAAPLFSPTFDGWLDYRPGARRAFLSFRFDRFIPIPVEPAKLQSGAGLVLREVLLPAGPEGAQVTASLDRAPAPGKAVKEATGWRYTFVTPIRLLAGQRLDFRWEP